jgi:hypothetical protein
MASSASITPDNRPGIAPLSPHELLNMVPSFFMNLKLAGVDKSQLTASTTWTCICQYNAHHLIATDAQVFKKQTRAPVMTGARAV